jgi:hypothetical protein
MISARQRSKMVFDIVEKDFVAIAGLHEVFSGINFVEHDFGSAAMGSASTPVIMSVDLLISLSPYYLPVTPHFLDDSTCTLVHNVPERLFSLLLISQK